MKRLTLILAVFALCCAAFGQERRPFALQVQNNGSAVGTVTGVAYLNLVSGCTATQSGNTFNITCTGSGSGTVSGQANGVIPLGTTATSITQQSSISDNGTTVSTKEPLSAQNFVLGPVNPTVSIPGSTAVVSSSPQTTTTISGSASTTTVWDLTSASGFAVGMGACATSAGSVSTVHCGGPAASATNDCVGTITVVSGNNITVTPACNSAPASGATIYHDETLAARACANLATITNEQQCVWPQGTYNLDAPLAACGAGDINAEICMPVIDTTVAYTAKPATAVEFTSAGRVSLLNITTSLTPGVVFQTDNSSTTAGNALVGCEGSNSGGATSKLTNVDFVSYGVEYLVPGNGIAALQLKYCTGVNLQNFVITGPQQGTQYASAPTQASSWGLEMPMSPQGGLAYVQNGRIDGFYNALAYFEGADVSGIVTGYSTNCILAGSNAAILQHESLMGMIQAAFCVNVLGSVDNEFGTSGINAPVDIKDLNVEHDASPTWAQTACDLNDTSNKLEGMIFYKLSNATTSGLNLTLCGGAGVKTFNLQTGMWSNLPVANLAWSPAAPVNTYLNTNTNAAIMTDQDANALVITPTAAMLTTASGSANSFVTPTLANFTGHHFAFSVQNQLVPGPLGASQVYPWIQMGLSSTQYFALYIYNDGSHGWNVYVAKYDNGGFAVVGAANGVTYSPSNMATFRMCEASGTLYADYAPLGALPTSGCGTTGQWTNLGSTTITGWVYTSNVLLSLGVTSTASQTLGSQPGSVRYSGISVDGASSPGGAPTSGTLSAGPGLLGTNAINTVISSTVVNAAGHFTNLQVVTALGGTCSTVPVFNVFDGTSNTGSTVSASASTQTKGNGTSTAQTLTFAAGDVIGIYISTAGVTCTTDQFIVSAQYSIP